MRTLKELRNKHNIRQQDLSEVMGVSRSTVAMWETGKSFPDPNALVRLADYFGVTVDFLLERAANGKGAAARAPAARVKEPAAPYAVGGVALTPEEASELEDYARYLLSKRKGRRPGRRVR
jgi:transcriptional regulator with XRE-family HTH domain